jgi:RND family efflux transporter MFP subunit
VNVKKSILVATLVVGAALGLRPKLGSIWFRSQPAAVVVARPTTAVVERRDISFAITAAGEIGPSEQVSVRPEVNGKIKDLPVEIGDKVKKGEVLFTLDDSDLQIEKAARETEIEAAQLALDKAKRNWTRSEELFGAKLISVELYEDTKTEYEQAKNALVRATQNLNLVKERLVKTRIDAPFDCTVLTRPVSVGQAVSGSGGFNSGTEVLTIADLTKMIIMAHVNQADVTRLRNGQSVEIEVDSVPGLTLKGVVERVAPQAIVKNNLKGYPVRIVVTESYEQVRPGMTASIVVPIASTENAIAVPLAAVFTEQGERYAYVKKGAEFEKRVLQIGLADYDYAEVLSGLYPGEMVSLEDKDRKTPGGKPDALRGPAKKRPGTKAATSMATNSAAPGSTSTNTSTRAGVTRR